LPAASDEGGGREEEETSMKEKRRWVLLFLRRQFALEDRRLIQTEEYREIRAGGIRNLGFETRERFRCGKKGRKEGVIHLLP